MTWTDRALLVVGAHISMYEDGFKRFRRPEYRFAAVRWRAVYNRLLTRKIRLTKTAS